MKVTHTKCMVAGCTGAGYKRKDGKVFFVKGYCNKHYKQFTRDGSLPPFEKPQGCKIDGCTGVGFLSKDCTRIFSRGYCVAHYTKLYKYGNPLAENKQLKGHQVTKHPLYGLWKGIKQRTSDPNHTKYHNYGGRGIKVCERWSELTGFLNFIEDMSPRPSNRHSIDRIDVDGPYSPENCRWALPHIQSENTRKGHKHLGVHYYKPTGKWIAYIGNEGKFHRLGHYCTLKEALQARKNAEKRFGITYPDK